MTDLEDGQTDPEESVIPSKAPASNSNKLPATRHQLKATEEFKITIAIATGLTVLAQVGAIALAVFAKNQNAQIVAVIENLSSCAKFGFGAIVGLLGGSKR